MGFGTRQSRDDNSRAGWWGVEQGVERSERSWEEAKEARRRGGERREGDLVDEGEGAKIFDKKIEHIE